MSLARIVPRNEHMTDRTTTRALGDLLGAPEDAPQVILRLRRHAVREVNRALKRAEGSARRAAKELGCGVRSIERWRSRGLLD